MCNLIYNKLSDWWYKKCKKSKFCNWIDDNILWYVWTLPREWYLSIRHWFVCNFNIYHWRLVKEAFLMHPWDGGFLLSMEERMIDKQLHWFEHHQRMVDEQYNEIMNSLRLAKYCLHVLNNETELFHYEGDVESIPQKRVTDEDGNQEFVDCDEDEAEVYRMVFDNHFYFYDGPRVNKRNARRFMSQETIERDFFKNGNLDHELYIAKCRHLYYLIRERCTDLWWD